MRKRCQCGTETVLRFGFIHCPHCDEPVTCSRVTCSRCGQLHKSSGIGPSF